MQSRDYIMFEGEEALATRIIPIKGRNRDRGRLPANLRPYWGDAVAWFEGNTLVVETVYHAAKTWEMYGAPPETTRTIERFTRRIAPAGLDKHGHNRESDLVGAPLDVAGAAD